MTKHSCLTEKVIRDTRKGLYVSEPYACSCGKVWQIKVTYVGPIEGITAKEAPYEIYAGLVKKRDSWRCVRGCEPRGPVDDKGHHKLLKVVRLDPWQPDRIDNLETVCGHKGSKCLPDWE
jgi:hypothetical protein